MKLYNSLTRQKSDFKPQSDTVTLYTCGPTVYDYAHIGNLRAFIFDDLLRRSLEAAGYTVKHVMNITDVGHLVSDEDEGEDKLEKGALREQKTVWQVAESYTTAFKFDAQALNILPPNGYSQQADGLARATDFIDSQIEMVQLLLAKGYAYQTKSAIYFDVTKSPDYGQLSGQKLADKEVGARNEVVTDPDKRHPYDFAVWFFTVGRYKDHSMHWPTPWGEGFPGWHLECSAIIHSTLGEPIDIHTGGVDHIGTHHTNEIAQTEAAFGQPLARFWLHNQFILVNGTKMSKSKGNYYTLKDLTDRDYHPLAYRLLCLQAHYRSELNFTLESLEAAQNFLINLYAFAALQYQPAFNNPGLKESYTIAVAKIKQALSDDLNSPIALGWLSGLASQALEPSIEHGIDIQELPLLLKSLDEIFGLNLSSVNDLKPNQKQLIKQRQEARDLKDFTKSDQLRQQLAEEGIAVEDTPRGPRWRRTKL